MTPEEEIKNIRKMVRELDYFVAKLYTEIDVLERMLEKPKE